MSASVEIFDTLAPQARAFTRGEHRRTGAAPDAKMLYAFLAGAVRRYRESGGVEDLTDAVVRDTTQSIAAHCLAMPVRGYSEANRRLFSHLAQRAKAWAQADRRERRAPVDRDRLRAYLQREVSAYVLVPGQAVPEADRDAVVEKLTTFFGRMGQGKPAPLRPASTAGARDLLDCDVHSRQAWEVEVAAREGRVPRRLSIDALTDALAVQIVRGPNGTHVARDTGVTRSAVRGAVERMRGHPRRAALIDRLPPTARDLVGVLEGELPQKRVSVVTVAALASKLWAPAQTPAARRQHVRRLRVAGAAIEAAGIGLRIVVVGDHVVIGRGRVLPTRQDALATLVADAQVVRPRTGKNRVHALTSGLVPSRQGMWGTIEGEVAKSLARTVTSKASLDDVWVTLAAAGKSMAAEDVATVWEQETPDVRASTPALIQAVEGGVDTRRYGQLSAQAPAGAALLRDLTTRAYEAGLDQAWADLVRTGEMATRLRRASESSARERVRRIGAAYAKATTPEAWEAVVLLSTATARPGRRHRHPMPTPAKSATATAPLPTHAPAPTSQFYPTPVPLASISLGLAEDLNAHWSVNKIRPAMKAMRAIYLGYDIADCASLDIDELPQPVVADEVLDGLRRLLRWWKSPELAQVARINAELGGVLREAVVAAGLLLRDHGTPALAHARGVVTTIALYATTVANVRALPGMLSQREEHARWLIAQAVASKP